MHHKRGRPKNRRAGCLMCKPHKGNGQKRRLEEKPIKTGGGRMRKISAAKAAIKDIKHSHE